LLELNDKLQLASITDGLTKLYNRRKLDEVLGNEFEKYKRYKTEFAVILSDIDKFKLVNDRYGHSIGDDVLCEIAKILRHNTRNIDVVGRWGGEEFIAIIKVDDNEYLHKVAEKIRILVSKSSYLLEDGKDLAVTISIGGSLIKPEDSITDLIERADANMYISKTTGRNKVTIK